MAKVCNVCKKPKSNRDMKKRERENGSVYIFPLCLKCSLEKITDWQKKETRMGRRWRHLKRRYGMTRQQYMTLLKKQKGLCAICKKPPDHKSVKGRVLAVDHNHATKQNRGLLCFGCNVLVALLENSSVLKQVLRYLKKYEKEG